MAEVNTGNAPVFVIQNIHLEPIERAVYSRDYERASGLLLAALRSLKQGGGFVGYPTDQRVLSGLYTRMAAAVTAMMADPGFKLTTDGFGFMASEHAVVDLLFRASAFRTSDHLLAIVSDASRNADGRPGFNVGDGPTLAKFLVTYSLRSGFGAKLSDVFAKAPQTLFPLWAGMVASMLTVSKDAFERREELLGLHGTFEDCTPTPNMLLALSDAFMYSSYGVRPDKHEAKATIVRSLRRLLERSGAKTPSAAQLSARWRDARSLWARGGKPTLLVPTEWFNGMHAMFRCYAPALRQLRKHFVLVGMSRALDIDEVGKAEFDHWVEVKSDGMVLREVVDRINELAPAAIYYPSVGMAAWWVVCASLRLAPLQFMTLGHPASSMSPHMDFVIAEDGSVGDASLFSEKVVTIPPASCRFTPRADAALESIVRPLESERNPYPTTVEVAVPAMLCKLNSPFIDALAKVSERCEKEYAQKVRYHFFVNMIGVNLYQAAAEIRERLPTALIYERGTYETYMGHLAKCHLHFCTFPFGGTNSTIDSMLLGIPVLTIEGAQPHERFDAVLVRRAGLEVGRFVASDVDDFVEKACDAVCDHDGREAARRYLLRDADLAGRFYGEPAEDRRTAFGDGVRWMCDNLEMLRASEKRVFLTPEAAAVRLADVLQLEPRNAE